MDEIELLYDKSLSARYSVLVHFFRYPQGMRRFIFKQVAIQDGRRILDAGCGFGILSKAIAEKTALQGSLQVEQHAFDISPAMLNAFREFCPFKVALAQSDVRTLPYPDNHFDLVLTAAMLEYVPNIEDALDSLRRTLKAGGLLYVFMSRRTLLNSLLFKPFGNPTCYSPRQLRTIMNKIGFLSVRQIYFPPSFFWLNAWGCILQATK